jgi:ankyrin repeat protein
LILYDFHLFLKVIIINYHYLLLESLFHSRYSLLQRIHLQLCNAAAQGNVQQVTELITLHGADVNYRHCGGDEGLFPLFLSARAGHEETTAALLHLGADVEMRTLHNITGSIHSVKSNIQIIIITDNKYQLTFLKKKTNSDID